jgi:mycoredoxin
MFVIVSLLRMEVAMQKPAIVYYKPGCPFGIRLRAVLRMRNIPYVAVRFRDDEAGATQVRAVNDGNEISPTVRVGDIWLTNPRWRQVAAAM